MLSRGFSGQRAAYGLVEVQILGPSAPSQCLAMAMASQRWEQGARQEMGQDDVVTCLCLLSIVGGERRWTRPVL